MNKINILIVDDEALHREGMRSLLEKEPFVNAIYEAEDEESYVRELQAHRVDIILLDVRLRKTSGLELFRKLKDLHKDPIVIVVTGLSGLEVIVNLLKSGVHSIIYKLSGYDEIKKAIMTTLHSGSYFPEPILKIIRNHSHRWNDVPTVLLSFKEKELLKAIAEGVTTKAIAPLLNMTPGSTDVLRTRLMRKVGVSNAAELLAYAYRNGIL